MLDGIVPSQLPEVRPIKDAEWLSGHSLKERYEPAENERKEENENEGQSLLPCVLTKPNKLLFDSSLLLLCPTF